MGKQVVINVEEKQIRVAILEQGKLAELYIEDLENRSLVGNIYKGRIMEVVPGLQAAFVDIGLMKNAFLHFTDLPKESLPAVEVKKRSLFRRSPAEKDIAEEKEGLAPEEQLRPNMEILVQIKRDALGTKPPRVTADISLPGRYLVMLPFSKACGGVSRKIREVDERLRLKRIITPLRQQLAGFIVRTAALQQAGSEILRDVKLLRKRWGVIWRKARNKSAPTLLYNEQDIIFRLVRDVFNEEIDEIIIDSPAEYKKLRHALKIYLPSLMNRIALDTEAINIFEGYDLERQIHQALRRTVRLKSGGYVIFDELSALTAIDVNSGGFVAERNLQETILRTNLEAAETIARQIKLRDIGGLIVIDFIDMANDEDRIKVWRRFHELMQKDRATTRISQFTEFGLLQLTRKRTRQSLKKLILIECPYCKGSGQVLSKNELWHKLKYEILSHLEAHPGEAGKIEVLLNRELYNYINQEFNSSLIKMAKQYKSEIKFLPDEGRHIEDFEVRTILQRGKRKQS